MQTGRDHDEAAAEKAFAAERSVAYVRAAVVAVNAVVYALYLPRGPFAGLAFGIVALASLYSVGVLALRPYRRYPVLLSAYFTTATDGALILLWVFATGGVESPFYLLWYLSVVAVAMRFDYGATVVAGAAYSLAYVLLAAATGELVPRAVDVALRVSYILFVAALSALGARNVLVAVEEKLEMRERMKEARSAEAKFRGLLEAAPDAIVIHDRDGRIVLVNSRVERIFGYPRAELLGAPVDLLLPERFRGRGGFSPEIEDLHGRRKDGSEFPAEATLSPMTTEEGPLVTSVVRDISERRKAEEERLAALERLKELERLRELDTFKTQFINSAAHELGTPLTPIKLQLHLLKNAKPGTLGDTERKSVEILDRNVERLAQLVRDVLEAARIQATRLGINKQTMDLNRLVLEVVESYQEPARHAGVALESHLTPDLVVRADQQRINQVLFNLLGNALKFTPPGGRVIVETGKEADVAVVRVRDTGIGLTPEQASRLFRPFSQVHDTMQKTRAGAGLGLYISKGIVELHGGHIRCESPGPGKGSTFVFTIPPEEAVVPPLPEKKAERRPEDAIARRARELI